MIKEKIIQTIGPCLVGKIRAIMIETGTDKVKAVIKEKRDAYYLELYKTNLNEDLLKKYGNDIFYDDLCHALLEENFLECLLNRCKDRALLDDKADTELLASVMRRLKTQVYNGMLVKEVLEYIARVAFESFNQLQDPENIMLKNIIKRESDKTQECISGVRTDTNKLLSQNENMVTLLEQLNEKIMLNEKNNVLSENWGNLTPADIELLQADNYAIKVTAQNADEYFRISFEVRVDSRKFSFENFENYISYLRFAGKEDTLEICRFTVRDFKGNVVKEYEDHTYSGLKISLPDVFTEEVELGTQEFQTYILKIKPQFTYFRFQVENDEGDILVQDREYKIERECKEDGIHVDMVETNLSGQLGINFEWILNDNDMTHCILNINVVQHNEKRVSSNLEFCNLMESIWNSAEVIGRNILDNREIFKSSGISSKNMELIENLALRKSFYKNLRKLENKFSISFNVPNKIEKEEVENVHQISELLKVGIVNTGSGKMTIEPPGFEIDEEQRTELVSGKKFVFLYHYQTITVLDVDIPITDYIRVVMFSDDITIEENKIVMHYSNSYMYNEQLASLPENEIIDNLGNGKELIN